MKTIKEWFETLPDPYKTQALENSIQLTGKKVPSLVGALNSFIWSDTPQGREYWTQVKRYVQLNEPLPYAGQIESPTNALSALHAIALKEGIPIEEIMSVDYDSTTGECTYTKKDSPIFYINLKCE